MLSGTNTFKIVCCEIWKYQSITTLYQSYFSWQSLDFDKEIINYEEAEDVNVGELKKHVPTDHARYHLYIFKHTHDGDYTESTSKYYCFTVKTKSITIFFLSMLADASNK
jgi:hypothetical protein